MGAWTTASSNGPSDQQLQINTIPLLRSPTTPSVPSDDRVRGTTNDLFELLERVQSSRLDDQRCVLPAYFSQVIIIKSYLASFFILTWLIWQE